MRKAPTAIGKPPTTAPELASSAAPGVDQATEIGMRVRSDSMTPEMPMAMERAIRPEAASAGEAPVAARP